MLDFRAFNETENHEALNLRIRRVNCPNDPFLTAFQGCQCVADDCHNCL
jgi:hypothetical protein